MRNDEQGRMQEMRIILDIQRLVSGYWYEVDFNESRDLGKFFTEDCVYVGGSNIKYHGRAGIDAFYENAHAMRDVPDRTVRHCISNLNVLVERDDIASAYYVCTTYGSAGKPPLVGMIVPSQITDIRLKCVREADGVWRIRDFCGEPIFVSPHSLVWKQTGWDTEGSPAQLTHHWPRPLGPTTLDSDAN